MSVQRLRAEWEHINAQAQPPSYAALQKWAGHVRTLVLELLAEAECLDRQFRDVNTALDGANAYNEDLHQRLAAARRLLADGDTETK